MTDANLVRVLQAQSTGRVGLVRHDTVARGPAAIGERFAALRAQGVRLAVADAVRDADLESLAEACAGLRLVTAGSGLALGLPAAYRRAGLLREQGDVAGLPAVGGGAAVLAGSCSLATNAQVRHWIDSGRPARRIDPLALAGGEPVSDETLSWAGDLVSGEPVLLYATSSPEATREVQRQLGVERAGALVEQCLSRIASGLVERGVRRLVVAGGETSGAVVQALGVRQLRIGPTIDPGVPWTQAEGRPLLLALKSGNFGSEDFFARSLAMVH
jgi:uncharacterized protein YgbK (DUF1537 family)